MNDQEIKEAKTRLASALKAIYEMHDKAITEAVIKLWWALVQVKGIDEVLEALTEHTMSPAGKFLPKPADIIEIIDGPKTGVATDAWYKVLLGLKRGTNVSVVFDDPIVNTVISRMGGWINFGGLEEKQLGFKEKNFKELYIHYLSNPPEQPVSHLIGREEDINTRLGYQIDPPILIGDKTKALQNYQAGLEFKKDTSGLKRLQNILKEKVA